MPGTLIFLVQRFTSFHMMNHVSPTVANLLLLPAFKRDISFVVNLSRDGANFNVRKLNEVDASFFMPGLMLWWYSLH